MISYKQLEVRYHVSEKLLDIITFINTGRNIMLKAPTGSGKTHAMLKLKEEILGKKIAFLCPTRALVDNIGKDNPDVPCSYGSEFLNANKRSYYIVTTYDSIKQMAEWEHPPELLIIDEAHLIIGHSEFRDVTADLLGVDTPKVFLSATPEIIEGWTGLKHLEIKKRGKSKNVKIARLGRRKPKSIIMDIIMGRFIDANTADAFETFLNKSKLKMIRYNNKKELKDVFFNLPKKYQQLTAMYYSERAELYEIFPDGDTKRLEKGEIPDWIEILLVTSIYDAGISLDVKQEVDCFAITNNNKKMPHPIDMVQLQNRVREKADQLPMNLTIIGNYGDYELDDIEVWPTTKKPALWLKYAFVGWDTYRELDKRAYLGILDSYGITASEAKLPKKLEYKQGHRLSNIDIAKNMASFPKLFEEIKEYLNHAGRMDWLEYINGTDDIRRNGTPPQAITIKNQLIEAIKCDLHFSLFMIEGRYNERRVIQLTTSVKLYQQDGRFKKVIDQLFENGLADVVMPLDEYSLLVTEQQKMVREVARLFYIDVRFQKGRDKKRLLIKPWEDLKEANAYLRCLVNGIDNTWYEPQFKRAVYGKT